MSFYIPPKVKVVSVSREGTFENKLSFILPSEKNGNKFRQEKSLSNWLKKKECLSTDILDNVPRGGYFINKGIKRVNYSSFGGSVQKLRIYNELGFEFEVDMACAGLLASSCNISKGEIKDECVLVWSDKYVFLLPVDSNEYKDFCRQKNAEKEHKELIDSGVDFERGQIFKQGNKKYIYMGNFNNLNVVERIKRMKYSKFVPEGNDFKITLPHQKKDYFIHFYETDGPSDGVKMQGLSDISNYIRDMKKMIPTNETVGIYSNNFRGTFNGQCSLVASKAESLEETFFLKEFLKNSPSEKNALIEDAFSKLYNKVIETKENQSMTAKLLNINGDFCDLKISLNIFETSLLDVSIVVSRNNMQLLTIKKKVPLSKDGHLSFKASVELEKFKRRLCNIENDEIGKIKVNALFDVKGL